MYKRKHRLINFLSWLLICTQILTSAGLATVGALQPTPEMAQAIAQEAGLGDWFAARAGDLIAWAQPLWGEPKNAAAQTAAPVA